MKDFSTVVPGTLAAGTVTDHGEIVSTTLTAYEMADGTFVPYSAIHGTPKAATPLVSFS